MKKYLLIFLLSLTQLVYAENKNSDSTFYRHTFSIRPTGSLLGELKFSYQYHFNKKHGIAFNCMVPVFYIDKYSKQQIPLSFQAKDGWIEPFSLPNTFGIKYIFSKNLSRNYEIQTSIGYNYRYINDAAMSFGGGDHGGGSINFSQQRNEFPLDLICYYHINKSDKIALKFFVGLGGRLTRNHTNYYNPSIHIPGGFGLFNPYYQLYDFTIHNDNGWFILPSVHFGFILSFNFHKIKYRHLL